MFLNSYISSRNGQSCVYVKYIDSNNKNCCFVKFRKFYKITFQLTKSFAICEVRSENSFPIYPRPLQIFGVFFDKVYLFIIYLFWLSKDPSTRYWSFAYDSFLIAIFSLLAQNIQILFSIQYFYLGSKVNFYLYTVFLSGQ